MTAYVKTANHGILNMREKPEKVSKILARIPDQTAIEAEKENEIWSKVIYNGQVGYVMTEFLSNSNNNELQQLYEYLKKALALVEKMLKE